MKFLDILKEEINKLIDRDEDLEECNLEKNIIVKKLQLDKFIIPDTTHKNNLKLSDSLINHYSNNAIFIINIFNDIYSSLYNFKSIIKKLSLINYFFIAFEKFYSKIIDENDYEYGISNIIDYSFFKYDREIIIANSEDSNIVINNCIIDLKHKSKATKFLKKIINSYYFESLPIINLNPIIVFNELLNNLSIYFDFIMDIEQKIHNLDDNIKKEINKIKYDSFLNFNRFIYNKLLLPYYQINNNCLNKELEVDLRKIIKINNLIIQESDNFSFFNLEESMNIIKNK